MAIVTIQISDEYIGELSAIVEEFGGKVISVTSDKKTRLLNEIKEGLKEVRKIREGKGQSYTMFDLFNGE